MTDTKLRALIAELGDYLTSIHEASAMSGAQLSKLENGALGALKQVRVSAVCALLRIKAVTQ